MKLFQKIEVPISNKELDKIWKEITENKKTEKIDYGMFKRFFMLHDTQDKKKASFGNSTSFK